MNECSTLQGWGVVCGDRQRAQVSDRVLVRVPGREDIMHQCEIESLRAKLWRILNGGLW